MNLRLKTAVVRALLGMAQASAPRPRPGNHPTATTCDDRSQSIPREPNDTPPPGKAAGELTDDLDWL